jgi:hypothetical protein
MTHESATRVVYHDIPYLVVDGGDGGFTVFGPFDPGTEPSLVECTPEREVTDPDLRDEVVALRAVSPDIPPHASSLAERE